MNSVPDAEASLDGIIFFIFFFLFHIQHYDELMKLLPHMHACVRLISRKRLGTTLLPFGSSLLG